MKKVFVALVCTLGAVACGEESRPAESPTTTTSVTTETTTTRAPYNTTTPSTTAPSASAPSTTAPLDGRDSTQPLRDWNDTSGTTSTTGATSSAGTPPATTGTGAAAPSSDNPGVANGTKDATNTKINDRDRHGALTPMNQGGGADRDITAAIRRAVVADKSLSFTAKNVKIITVGGKVTLRGPVKSDEEKASIESKAKAATGVSEVDDQLEVKK